MNKIGIKFNADIDVKSKMYAFVSDVCGVCVLKHFTLIDNTHRAANRWKWISIDGREVSNVLIQEPIIDGCMAMYKTPKEAFSMIFEMSLEITIYEFDGPNDMIKNLAILFGE